LNEDGIFSIIEHKVLIKYTQFKISTIMILYLPDKNIILINYMEVHVCTTLCIPEEYIKTFPNQSISQ